jgi:hypothetical protein
MLMRGALANPGEGVERLDAVGLTKRGADAQAA